MPKSGGGRARQQQRGIGDTAAHGRAPHSDAVRTGSKVSGGSRRSAVLPSSPFVLFRAATSAEASKGSRAGLPRTNTGHPGKGASLLVCRQPPRGPLSHG